MSIRSGVLTYFYVNELMSNMRLILTYHFLYNVL